jgi:hypothetical protein
LLAGTAVQTVRATLLAFFALSYGATVASHAATIGIPGSTLVAAGILAPIALLGGLVGRPIGDRIGTDGFRTALPFWRSRYSPSPDFILRSPRVSVFSLANHENLGAAHGDR